MGVHFGMAVVALRNVANERYQLHLLVNGNLFVLLASDLEKPECDAFKGTNRGQIRSFEPMLCGQAQESFDNFFSWFEDHRKCSGGPILNQLRVHPTYS